VILCTDAFGRAPRDLRSVVESRQGAAFLANDGKALNLIPSVKSLQSTVSHIKNKRFGPQPASVLDLGIVLITYCS
jgi:hypothetical protein